PFGPTYYIFVDGNSVSGIHNAKNNDLTYVETVRTGTTEAPSTFYLFNTSAHIVTEYERNEDDLYVPTAIRKLETQAGEEPVIARFFYPEDGALGCIAAPNGNAIRINRSGTLAVTSVERGDCGESPGDWVNGCEASSFESLQTIATVNYASPFQASSV